MNDLLINAELDYRVQLPWDTTVTASIDNLFDEDPSFPIPIQPSRGSDLNGFAPDIKIASAQTWTASFQRSLTRDMAMEVRYVGTYGRGIWEIRF